jgi:glycosyltransferase involved in cell wall biosynthesis
MKILFLCKRYYTSKDLLKDRFGRLFHLPVQLSRLGSNVSVIALDYRSTEEVSEYLDGVMFETASATMTRLPMLMNWLRESVRRLHPDVIIASGDSHVGFFGERLATEVGAQFVFDVYDYYPAFGSNRIPGMKSMFRTAVKRADLVLCASIPLMERLSGDAKKLALIENGVDRKLFTPLDKQAAREAIGIGANIPLVGYFGAVTPKRGPLLFAAVRQLRGRIPGMTVLVAGKVVRYELVDEFIHYRGALPQAELPTLISACDVVSVPYESDPQIDLSGACKIAEYLACGRPIVATRVAGHEHIFKDVPTSLCDPNPCDLANALELQLKNRQTASFPAHLDWSDIGARLHGALQRFRN